MTTVKTLAKWAMTAVAPQTATVIMSARARAHSQRLARQWGLIDLNRRLVSHLGAVVQAGPFRGMALTPMTHDEHLGPYLLGTYESELHPWIEHLTGRRFRQVLDVGSKFGYYAVGLGAPVAVDTDRGVRSRSLGAQGDGTNDRRERNVARDGRTALFCRVAGSVSRAEQPDRFGL
jgi:hypothetical protein